MNSEGASRRDIRRIHRLLRELAALAEEEEFEEGLPAAVGQYNAVVQQLERLGVVSTGMFPRLGEQGQRVTFGELGVQSRLLAGYLEDDLNGEDEDECRGKRAGRHGLGVLIGLAPFLGQEELRELVRSRLKEGERVDPGLLIGLAPFLGKEELNRIVRAHMPEFFGDRSTESEREAEQEGAPEPPRGTSGRPERPQRPDRPAYPEIEAGPRPPAEPRMMEGVVPEESIGAEGRFSLINTRLQQAAQELARPGLSDARRAELSDLIARLSREQERILQRHMWDR